MPRTLSRWLSSFRPKLTQLEDRTNPVSITTTGTTAVLDLDFANEVVTFSTDGTSVSVSTTNSITLNGTPVGTPQSLNGFTNFTVTDTADGAGVTFANSTGVYTGTFNVTLDNAPGVVTFNGSSSFGTNSVSVTTARNIAVTSGASLTTTDGAIILSANQQPTATSGDFVGVDVRGNVTSVTGSVLVNGRGGTDGGGLQDGVRVSGGGTLHTTGSGTVVVFGSGGATDGGTNAGVNVTGANSAISSGGGGVTVLGVGGGSGASERDHGVVLALGGVVTAGGMGSVTVQGTGGAGFGDFHFGVWVTDTGSAITSNGGNVRVTGIGGASGGASRDNFGVEVEAGGLITAGGMGTVTVLGTGGNGTGTGASNHGVLLSGSGARITSSGGDVSVAAAGGGGEASENNVGVYVFFGGEITAGGTGAVIVSGIGGAGTGDNNGVRVGSVGSLITSGGGNVFVAGTSGGGAAPSSAAVRVELNGGISTGADVTVIADSFNVDGTGRVTAGSGTVTLRTLTNGRAIDLGGADSATTLGISDAELDQVTGGNLVIGYATSGNLNVTADISRPAATTVQLVSGADISLGGNINTAGGTLLFTHGSGGVTFSRAGTDVTATVTSFTVGSQLLSTITGTTADVGYTRLVANGSVNLSGLALNLSGAYSPLHGESFTLISANSIVGTLTGLPNGAAIPFNGGSLVAVYTATSVTLVADFPPVITSLNVPTSGASGHPVAVSATATDADGPTDLLTFTWNVSRNGVPVTSGVGTTFSFTPAVGGPYTVSLTVTDLVGGTATATRVVQVTPPARVVTAVGNTVRVLNPLDNSTREFTPYPGFNGGLTVATADLNGDGLLDIVTGAGAGGGPHVKVFDGASGAEIASFFAYAANFSGGVFVAAGGGKIVTGAGAGGGPHVKAFTLDGTETASFFAYGASFTGGVRVAVGDVNSDGVADIVTGAGAGGGPHVKVFDGASQAETLSFFAFDAAFTGGVFVAATNGRIAVGADAGGGPHVKLFNPAGNETASFFAYNASFRGGVRVAFADANADGDLDLLTGAGPGGGPHVKAFNIAPFTEVASFFAANPLDPRGVFV